MLRDIPLFKDLRDEQLEFLTTLTHRFTYPKNSILITQGELSKSLYVVLEGKLKVKATSPEGKQTVFAFLGPGEFVGELSLLDDGPRSATVEAAEATQTMIITQEVFHRFVESFPETLLPMLRMMAGRVRVLDDTVFSMATMDVYSRVVRLFNKMAKKEGDRLVIPRLTQQEIAEMVGAAREMISRIMKELRKGEYISIDAKKRIIIEKKLPPRW